MQPRHLTPALALLTTLAPAQNTTTLESVRDNTMYSESGTLANGVGTLMLSGNNGSGSTRRALIAFDVAAAIPSGAIVQSARLELTIDRSTVATPIQFDLHRLTADWGEGASNAGAGGPGSGPGRGATALAGDATWTHRAIPSTTWATAGGDFVATVSASTGVSGSSGRVSWTSAQLAADVQAWLNGSQPNHGWILRSDETALSTGVVFRTHEFATAADRPALVVTWAPAATVSPIGNGCSGSTGSQLLMSASGPPTVPNPTFSVSLTGGPTGPRAFFVFATASPVPLPLSATCFIYGDPTTLLATAVLPGPLAVPIPGATSLYGAKVVFQGLAVDQAALLLVTSNGLDVTLGL